MGFVNKSKFNHACSPYSCSVLFFHQPGLQCVYNNFCDSIIVFFKFHAVLDVHNLVFNIATGRNHLAHICVL